MRNWWCWLKTVQKKLFIVSSSNDFSDINFRNHSITQNHNHFLALTIFLFFSFLAYFPERTFPNWFLRFFIFNFTCFYWLRILFFFALNIIRGFNFCFCRLLDPPPFFPLGLCLNLSFFSGFCLFYAFISVLDFL